MAKKAGRAIPEPTGATSVQSRDALQRLSYLYQASVLLDNIGLDPLTRPTNRKRKVGRQSEDGSVQPGPEVLGQEQREDARIQDVDQRAHVRTEGLEAAQDADRGALRPVARHLVRMMKEVAMKATVRMDPTVKRTVCKGCDTVLVPGFSSSVRIKPSRPHAHLVVYTCSTCLAQRRFPAPPHLHEAEVEPTAPAPTATAATLDPSPSLPTAARPRLNKRTKREKREARQAKKPAFFERKGHVVVRGSTVLAQDD